MPARAPLSAASTEEGEALTVPLTIIERDHQLETAAEGAAVSLGEFRAEQVARYGLRPYARAIGRSHTSVRVSIERWRERADFGSPGFQTGSGSPDPRGGRREPRAPTPEAEGPRESLTEQRWALAIDGLRLQAENFAAVAERMREMAPPSPDVKERLVGALDEAINNMQALRRHLRRN